MPPSFTMPGQQSLGFEPPPIDVEAPDRGRDDGCDPKDRPSGGEPFLQGTGFPRQRALTCESDFAAALSRVHSGHQHQPMILRGFAADWPAVHSWERDYLLSRWGDVRVNTAVGLPAHGVPFLVPASTLRRQFTVREFWSVLERERCWLDEQPLALFPGLEDDLRISELMSGRTRIGLNLWVGRDTKSGLHFDPTDNFLTMIRGRKLVAMAPLSESHRLYPFHGSIMKSRVDIEHPDFTQFPLAASVEMQIGWLGAGDVLYIPAGWWHYIASPSDSHHISVTCSFGRELSVSLLAAHLLRLGPGHVASVLRDFLMYGALGKPCVARFHDVPNGLQLYRKLWRLWGRDDGRVQEVGCTSADLPLLPTSRSRRTSPHLPL